VLQRFWSTNSAGFELIISHILPNITLETSLPEGWAELPQCHFTTLPAGPPLRSVWSDCVREPAETTLQWMANTGGADMLFNGEGEAFNVRPPSSSHLRNELTWFSRSADSSKQCRRTYGPTSVLACV
jgi:hypothetical protein